MSHSATISNSASGSTPTHLSADPAPARRLAALFYFFRRCPVRRPPAIKKPDPPLKSAPNSFGRRPRRRGPTGRSHSSATHPPTSEGNARRATRGSEGRARRMLRHRHRTPPAVAPASPRAAVAMAASCGPRRRRCILLLTRAAGATPRWSDERPNPPHLEVERPPSPPLAAP